MTLIILTTIFLIFLYSFRLLLHRNIDSYYRLVTTIKDVHFYPDSLYLKDVLYGLLQIRRVNKQQNVFAMTSKIVYRCLSKLACEC